MHVRPGHAVDAGDGARQTAHLHVQLGKQPSPARSTLRDAHTQTHNHAMCSMHAKHERSKPWRTCICMQIRQSATPKQSVQRTHRINIQRTMHNIYKNKHNWQNEKTPESNP